MRDSWPWLALALLGAYHGVNPAMGWLFAVALGLQERSRRAVVEALVPIAVGHEASVAVVAVVLGGAVATVSETLVRGAAALLLVGFGAWKLLRPGRHPRWVGFRVSRRELVGWSFLMSSAHGAGLMLMPVLLGLSRAERAHDHVSRLDVHSGALLQGAAAVLLHGVAMLFVMGVVAVLVYEKVGLGVLRRAWVNVELVWAAALVSAGVITVFS